MGFFGRLVARITTKPVTVVGVITPDSGGGALDDDDGWIAFLGMCPWRIEGEPLRRTHIALSRPLRSSRDIGAFEKTYEKPSVRRMRIRVRREDPGGLVVADVVELLGIVDDDAELSAAAAELRKPVIVDDPVLGSMKLDRRFHRFHTKRASGDLSYDLHVDQTGDGDAADVSRAAQIVARFEGRLDGVRDAVAAELVRTCGPGWTGAPLTPATVAEKLTLANVVVRDDDGLALVFRDGGVFFDHRIEAFVNAKLELTSASLAG